MSLEDMYADAQLPLDAQNEVRASFEARNAEFCSRMREILHEEYTIDVRECAHELHLIVTANGDSTLGATLSLYMDAFIIYLRDLVARFGDLARTCFNACVWTRKITFEVNPLDAFGSASSASAKHGVYTILAHRRWFGSVHFDPYRDETHETILAAIEPIQKAMNVLRGISIVARHSIDTQYDLRRIKEIQARIVRLIEMRISLDPCCLDVYAGITEFSEAHRTSDYSFGRHALDVFMWFLEFLCEMIQKDGKSVFAAWFQKILTKKLVKIRIVPVIPRSWFVIEDGTGFVQINPANWGFLVPSEEFMEENGWC